jgi:hypothetical protein
MWFGGIGIFSRNVISWRFSQVVVWIILLVFIADSCSSVRMCDRFYEFLPRMWSIRVFHSVLVENKNECRHFGTLFGIFLKSQTVLLCDSTIIPLRNSFEKVYLHKILYVSICSRFVIFFCGSGDWIYGFVLDRQVLYRGATFPIPIYSRSWKTAIN